MPTVIRAVVVVVAIATASATAFADGDSRVVLADKDPELLRAIRATLAPWRLEVVVENPADVHVLTTQEDARFIVWREKGELVVFDRDRKQAEHREAPAGPLDPVSAAAAALTVKTLMRLPPPADEAPPEVPPSAEIPPTTSHSTRTFLGVQAGAGVRRAGDFAGVANLAVFLKPPLPLRLGIAGEYASAVDAQGSGGFEGTWRDWNVLGLVGWRLPLTTHWELEPHVGMGVRRFVLDGRESMTERHERETLFMLRGGVFARVRFGRLAFGASAAVDASVGTPTYTKTGMGAADVFAVPPFALSVGLLAGADL